MCDGDESKGLFLQRTVFLNDNGQIQMLSKPEELIDEENVEVKFVYECFGCSVTDVLPLIGHDMEEISAKVVDNITDEGAYIPFQADIIEHLKTKWRAPGAYLVKQDDHLYGVIVNQKNEATIHGIVTKVLPNANENLVIVTNEGLRQCRFSTMAEFDATSLEDEHRNIHIGIVSINGFLFIKQNMDCNELILILNKAYIIIDGPIDWIRKNIELTMYTEQIQQQMEQKGYSLDRINTTAIERTEAFICLNAAIIDADDDDDNNNNNDNNIQLEHPEQQQQQPHYPKRILFGSSNAIVNYQAFKHSILMQHQLDK